MNFKNLFLIIVITFSMNCSAALMDTAWKCCPFRYTPLGFGTELLVKYQIKQYKKVKEQERTIKKQLSELETQRKEIEKHGQEIANLTKKVVELKGNTTDYAIILSDMEREYQRFIKRIENAVGKEEMVKALEEYDAKISDFLKQAEQVIAS